MCGILGGVFPRGVTESELGAFRRAVRTLGHRGPDAEAVTVIPEVGAVLAFRRLAIIDLKTGDQPMSTGAGHHIVFNGEIYNYREVRAELEAEGQTFRTASDTEVLLHTLVRHGTGGLQRLRGMFGWALLDTSRRRLLLGRDRLGVKQVYYHRSATGFFFASEPKALLALPWVKAELADDQLPAYFVFRCVPAPATLFRGICKLPPASVLTYDLNEQQASLEPYWRIPETGTPRVTSGEALEQFEETFLTAVRYRLVADVPVGAFLSGGLDSSLIVAAMSRLGHADLRTFSATFPGARDNEAGFARRVSRRFGSQHHEWAADSGAFLAALPRWVELNDDVVADASSLPLLQVSQLARANGCTVLLSGEGADELFGGYGSYHKFVLLRALARLVPFLPVRRGIVSLLAAAGVVDRADRPRVEEYFVRRGSYMGTAALLGAGDLDDLLAVPTPGARALPRARANSLAALAAFDCIRRIPDDLLVRTDRATMGASIEARVPFLDHHLVELALGLPSHVRALPGLSKLLLRRLAVRWRVPYQTVVHRKIGFQVPIGEWFRGPLATLWASILSERRVASLNYDSIGEVFHVHQRGQGRLEELLWRVMALELWYRRWIDHETDVLSAASEPSRQWATARQIERPHAVKRRALGTR